MMKFTPTEFWKWYAVLLGIYVGSFNMKISEGLVVNLRTEAKIWKELDEFNRDYEGMVIWKPHFDCSEKKRTAEFVGETQAMIVNDPSKSIRSIGESVSYQTDSTWRHSVFLIQEEKGSIFIPDHEEQEERPDCKAFQKTQTSPSNENALVFLK